MPGPAIYFADIDNSQTKRKEGRERDEGHKNIIKAGYRKVGIQTKKVHRHCVDYYLPELEWQLLEINLEFTIHFVTIFMRNSLSFAEKVEIKD